MKKVLKSVTALALLSSFAFADEAVTNGGGTDSKDLKKVIEDQGIYVETAKPGITLSGYVDAGYSYNFNGNQGVATRFPTDGGSSGRGSNFNLNAFKFALEKPLSTKNELSAGFRTDLIYGDDASALGNGSAPAGVAESNQLLVEQAFVDFNAPVGNGITFKVGKFVTPLGYEVIERPSNQDITYGNLFVNTIPLYHTGVLAAYKVNDIVNVSGGIVNGANGDQQNPNTIGGTFGSTSSSNGVGLLGTVNVTNPGGNANIQNGVFIALNPNNTSDAGELAAPAGTVLSSQALWVYDIWGQWKPKAYSNLTLGFNGDLGQGSIDGAYGPYLGAIDHTTTYGGAAVYAKYQFTKIFSLATRTDWLHTDNGIKFDPTVNAGSNDIYSWTLTAEYDAFENTMIRGEYRLDYGSEGVSGPVGDSLTSPDMAAGTTTAVSKGPAQLVDLEVVYSF